tara:strand:+ start:487 stop:717 length:231 start_codon:yes stop_codon:yes gene_type:complete
MANKYSTNKYAGVAVAGFATTTQVAQEVQTVQSSVLSQLDRVLDNGTASTTTFTSVHSGGNATTLFFTSTYDGGSA